jgi:hypothetical protein
VAAAPRGDPVRRLYYDLYALTPLLHPSWRAVRPGRNGAADGGRDFSLALAGAARLLAPSDQAGCRQAGPLARAPRAHAGAVRSAHRAPIGEWAADDRHTAYSQGLMPPLLPGLPRRPALLAARPGAEDA